MATFTTNYNFRKPADADFIENDTDLNANWDIADTEIKARANAIAALQAVDAKTRYVVKAATETVANSTTFQTDDELVFSVVAGNTYVFEMNLYLGGSLAKSGWDWKYRLSFPTGTMSHGIIGPAFNGIAAGGTASGDMQVNGDAGQTTSPTAAKSIGLSDDSHVFAIIRGSFVCTANGTVTLDWAQNTASGGAGQSSVVAGSWLKVVQVN